MADIEQVIAKARNTPPLSASAARLMQVVGNRDHSLQDVRAIVEQDSLLTATVLRLVNSAAFGLASPVDSISRAISIMGESMIVGIAIGICSSEIYDRPLAGYEAERGALWQHSLRTAITSRLLSRHAAVPVDGDVAFTAGLLHNIGKSILSEFAEGLTDAIVARIANGEAEDYEVAEQAVLGMDHCEVGAIVAEQWRLPPSLRHCIRYHHRPMQTPEAEYVPLVFAVHIADVASMLAGAGTGADMLKYRLDPHYSEYYELGNSTVEQIMLEAQTSMAKAGAELFE